MSIAVPFVNRKEELGELRNSLKTDKGEFHALVGPSGSGKSALLDQFQEYCEEEGILTVRHDIGEPKSEPAFIYRFLENWDHALPSSKWDSVKERVKDVNSEAFVHAAKFADPAVGTGTQIINAILSGALEDEELNNATDEVDFLVNILRDGPDEKIVVIIDQFDERRLSDSVSQDLDRAFREISRRSPENIVWCIASDHEFGNHEGKINHLRVGPLDSSAIEELVEKTGTDLGEAETDGDRKRDTANFVTAVTNFEGPNLTKEGLVNEIKAKTRGHPFMLSLFLQTVRDEDLSYAIQDLPMSERRIRNHLEGRLLDRMESQEEGLLRDVCVLEQFDSKLAAHLSGNTVAEARRILNTLKERSIIREVEGVFNTQTYRSHDLIRDFLQDEIMGARERQSRYNAIVVFSSRLHEQVNDRSPEDEIPNPEIESLCEQIRLQFAKVLRDEKTEPAVESVYDSCDNLDYMRRTNVENGLKYCFSVQDSELLSETIDNVLK